jgi:diphthamide biosynthesis methyltransferase
VLYKIFKKNVLPVNTDNWHKCKIFVRIDRNMHEKIHTLKFSLVDARKGINTITGTCMRKFFVGSSETA